MQPSQLFFDLVEAFEGLKLTAYQDKSGNWTIGYGTVYLPDGSKVQEGDTCTAEEAQSYLLHSTNMAQNEVNQCVTSAITQGGFDALCDFTYEEGGGALSESTLLKTVNADPENYDEITKDFLMWDEEKIDGTEEVIAGILRRRKCEAYLFQNGVNAPNFFEGATT
jgi:lysozyme